MARPSLSPRRSRGFTLIELMVALTGGLIFSGFVFMLAKDTTRFYQSELRLAAATHSAVVGFQRLRTDIARAGFLSTPNLSRDPHTCVTLNGPGFAGNPGLQNLSTLRIQEDGGDEVLPLHSIELMGSYASVDTFPIRAVMDGGGGAQVFLQPLSGAMIRLLGAGLNMAQLQAQMQPALNAVFAPGRVLRIVDKAGAQQFGIIANVNTANADQPFIQLAAEPALRFKDNNDAPCGLRGAEAGSLVNVVQRIRYSIQDLQAQNDPMFAPLFQGAADTLGSTRTELMREEVDWNQGLPLPGVPRELVAEYAVGLSFRLTAAVPPAFQLQPVLDANLPNFAGDSFPGSRQDQIRSVRALLAVRSSAPDRAGDLLPDGNDPIAMGRYRVPVPTNDNAPTRFARVRTLQAEIALRNQRNARWIP